jgi:hypothetical protein
MRSWLAQLRYVMGNISSARIERLAMPTAASHAAGNQAARAASGAALI